MPNPIAPFPERERMTNNAASFDLQTFSAALQARPRVWAIPAAVLGVLALGYVLFFHRPRLGSPAIVPGAGRSNQ
jgi:hypothetical protein